MRYQVETFFLNLRILNVLNVGNMGRKLNGSLAKSKGRGAVLSSVLTGALSGIDSIAVQVEVEIRGGQPRFTIIGLGDNAVRESRDRVAAAIKNSGFQLPDQILVSLSPAEVRKEGASFDLPIAIGVLAASKQIRRRKYQEVSFHGELSLDGRIQPVRGVLASVIGAFERGIEEVVVAPDNLREASLISGVRAIAFRTLLDLVRYLNGEDVSPVAPSESYTEGNPPEKLVSEVIGQESAKRGLVIAAAGGHNVLLVGPPGCGKSMLAERFSSILPPMTMEETLETVRIHSIAGGSIESLLAGERAYRSPHHVVTDVGLIGGGNPIRPGEATLAHNGVLFLDEFPEFRRSAIEALRGPMEAGIVHICRARSRMKLPARFQLVAAMNPCPCGRLGSKGARCECPKTSIVSYLRKLSQPILDRIDLQIEMESVPLEALSRERGGNLLAEEEELRKMVRGARERQLIRAGKLNARLSNRELSKAVRLSPQSRKILEKVLQRSAMSARGYMRLLKLALTLGDLEGGVVVEPRHIAEAANYRSLERISKFMGGGPMDVGAGQDLASSAVP